MNKTFFLSILCISFSLTLLAQTKEQLEKKREQLLTDIKYTQELLNATKKNKKNSMASLAAINKQIELRQNLIGNTQSQVNLFNNQIEQQKSIVEKKSAELEQLKKEYAEAIVKTYQCNKFANRLLFLVDAKTFSAAISRIKYLQKYAEAREKQAKEIVKKSKEIQSNITLINQKKQEKQKLLLNQLAEKTELNSTLQEKSKILQALKLEELKLQKTLTSKKAEANKLNNQIAAIIKKEIAEAKKKAAAEAAAKKAAAEKNKNNASTKKETPADITTTPEYDKLTSSFLGNKGKLPWPVDKGFVSKNFGMYNHPDLPGVVIENNGIDIKTDPNANVRTVFEGTVVGIINNPIFKNAVIISHGEYFTVYSKLESVNVSKGQKVTTKQTIGKVYTDDENQTEVHLEVWKGSEKINPIYWIYKK